MQTFKISQKYFPDYFENKFIIYWNIALSILKYWVRSIVLINMTLCAGNFVMESAPTSEEHQFSFICTLRLVVHARRQRQLFSKKKIIRECVYVYFLRKVLSEGKWCTFACREMQQRHYFSTRQALYFHWFGSNFWTKTYFYKSFFLC